MAALTGRCSWRSVIRSPSSIAMPPSPDRVMTCRPGSVDCAPMACGSALAMLPWLNEPISRRVPFIRRYRAAQMTSEPTSTVNTASRSAGNRGVRSPG